MIRVPEFHLTIPGPPLAWARPEPKRRGKHFSMHNAPATESGKERVWSALLEAGRPTIKTGEPGAYTWWALQVTVLVERPPTHYGKRGDLSADGRRRVRPTKPDFDNILKLIADALVQQGATPDDAYCSHAAIWKDWAGGGEAPATLVRCWRVAGTGVVE